MRRSPFAPCVAWILACAVSLAGGATQIPPAGYVTEVLDNGLSVSILPDPTAPIVATQVWYHVGSAHEDPGSRGLAHLFEHLMFGATVARSKEEYSRFHTMQGGEENAFTSNDETVYVSEIGPTGSLRVLEMEADRMRNLVLSEAELENEKRIVIEELRVTTENDPYSRVLVEAQKALLGKHPYALEPTGTKQDVAAATLDSCRRFYDAYYQPNHAHLVIVGPVDAGATLEAVRRLFGPIPAGGHAPPDVPALDTWSYPPEVDLSEDLPPVETALLGFPLPPPDSGDADALDLLTQLLAGGSVDLFREEHVRERHRAIEAGTEVLDLRRGGGIVFYAVNLPYRRKATAFADMLETRERLSRLDWLTDERLESARRAILREELSGSLHAAERADAIGRARWWLGDDRRAFDRAQRIRAVTREQVAAAYRRYVGTPTPIRLYIRPEKVPILVRLFGWMYPLVAR